jgi:hypothetical protein
MLQFARMSDLAKLRRSVGHKHQSPQWAGRVARHKGEIERADRRKRTHRASTSFFCRANAAKVGSEPDADHQIILLTGDP